MRKEAHLLHGLSRESRTSRWRLGLEELKVAHKGVDDAALLGLIGRAPDEDLAISS